MSKGEKEIIKVLKYNSQADKRSERKAERLVKESLRIYKEVKEAT